MDLFQSQEKQDKIKEIASALLEKCESENITVGMVMQVLEVAKAILMNRHFQR